MYEPESVPLHFKLLLPLCPPSKSFHLGLDMAAVPEKCCNTEGTVWFFLYHNFFFQFVHQKYKLTSNWFCLRWLIHKEGSSILQKMCNKISAIKPIYSISMFTLHTHGIVIHILLQFLKASSVCDRDICSPLSHTWEQGGHWTLPLKFYLTETQILNMLHLYCLFVFSNIASLSSAFILGQKWSVLWRLRPQEATNGSGVFEERTDLCDSVGSTWINWQLAEKH